MKPVWNADLMIEALYPFYDYCEKLTGYSFHHYNKVIRIFKSVKEQNDWNIALENPRLGPHLNASIIYEPLDGISSPFGYGEVINSGRIDTEAFLKAMRDLWVSQDLLIETSLDYSSLIFNEESVVWQGKAFTKVIFCEGYKAQLENPFFKNLPFAVTKGEVLQIESDKDNWGLSKIVNSGIFVMPLRKDNFKIGATYALNTFDEEPTREGREELLLKLKEITDKTVKVVRHRAGIRPTVKDRKPLLGVHPVYPQLAIFNGLGSRGVLMGPWLADTFISFLLGEKALPREIDIIRFSEWHLDHT
jgi:glycine/D-amino acid oxidase-like deaminating enzyme